jgi:hypothetical protein
VRHSPLLCVVILGLETGKSGCKKNWTGIFWV